MSAEGKKLRDAGLKWLERIEAAGKLEKTWMDDADKAVVAYTGEQSKAETATAEGVAYDFNILFANVETIVPAVINSPPAPDIRRRFGSDDPVAKDLAEIMERAIRVQVDDSSLQVELEAMAQDGFLAGRGLVRIRFESDFEGGETTDEELAAEDRKEDRKPPLSPAVERAKNERCTFEAVSWRDFRHGPAKRWEDIPWAAYRHHMPPDEMEEFADADMLGQQASAEDSALGDDDHQVWEIWEKRTRNVWFVRGTDGKVLKKVADPLELSRFYPHNTPIQPIELNGRLMPVNPFSIYRRLADELDVTTKRIRIITKQLKVKGWYGISATDLQNVLNADDNEFVPIADAEIWAKNGGLQGAVTFWPVEKLIVVLAQLYQSRDQTKQSIYEITGISDIVRGASDARETAAAQNIKSQWGSLRIQKMQRMMERAARELFVMMSEIIPSKFSPETLQRITEIQLVPTQQELTPVPLQQPQVPQDAPPEAQQQALQQAQAQQQQAEQARLGKIKHLEALKLLMSEKLSMFYRVDVETDSTVRADLTRQKTEATEFMTAASGYFNSVGPLVSSGQLPVELAGEIFSSFARMFNLGKSVEDALDKMISMAKQGGAGGQKPKTDPKAEAAAAEQKRKAEDAAVDRDIKMQGSQLDMQIKRDNAQTEAAIKGTELQIKQLQLQMVQRQLSAQQFGMGGF